MISLCLSLIKIASYKVDVAQGVAQDGVQDVALGAAQGGVAEDVALGVAHDVAQGDAHDVAQGVAQEKEDFESIIIKLIKENKKITRKEMADKISVSVKTVERRIKKMENIRYIGSGASGYWEVL